MKEENLKSIQKIEGNGISNHPNEVHVVHVHHINAIHGKRNLVDFSKDRMSFVDNYTSWSSVSYLVKEPMLISS